MNAYIYQAAMLCEPCALLSIRDLKTAGISDTGDSDTFPQGPYADGGGEADTPQHCDHCHTFLENPLTCDGLVYVVDAISRFVFHPGDGDRDTLKQWADHYGLFLPDHPLTWADLRAEWKLAASEQWGDAIGAWFDVAGELYTRGLHIPDDWRYRPGISARELGNSFAFDCAMATDEALQRAGAVFTRYCRALKHAGKDY